jgi:uncharacterized protein (TIGR00290 family)
MSKKNVALFWSGGKDAAMALLKIMQSDKYEAKLLITTITENNSVAMHGIPFEFIRQQAIEIDLPILEMKLAEFSSNALYAKVFSEVCQQAKNQYEIEYLAFGDIYLEEIKTYREKLSSENDLKALFPLWKIPSDELFKEFIQLGFKAKTIVVDASKLDKSWLGRELNNTFKENSPEGIDICGEDGAYHTLIYDAPYFKNRFGFPKGSVIKKELSLGEYRQLFYYLVF